MKPIAWYDPTNGAVSTDKDSPLFTPLGQVLPLYTKVEQEPVAWMFQHEETGRTTCVDAQQVEWGFDKGNLRLKKIAPLYTTPPEPVQERNFCPRCGKRTADLTTIHTCTPPQEKNT